MNFTHVKHLHIFIGDLFMSVKITVSKKVAVFFPCMNSAEEYMGPCMKNYGGGGVVVVCYTATFSVVMQRSSPQTASEN